jgi:hypothetical protein
MTFLEAVTAAERTGCVFFLAPPDDPAFPAGSSMGAWELFGLSYDRSLMHWYWSPGGGRPAQGPGSWGSHGGWQNLRPDQLRAHTWTTWPLVDSGLRLGDNVWNPLRLELR